MHRFIPLVLLGCAAAIRTGPPSSLIPKVVTEPVDRDADDPAIWIHPDDPSRSLVLGTDKDEDGALVVFDLKGRILREKTVTRLKRPNNVDVEYGFTLNGAPVDIAAVTERLTGKLRIFGLPDMLPLDGGGIDVFAGEPQRAPMGISLYKRPSDGAIFAVVGRKEGPSGRYLWQYRLEDDRRNGIRAVKIREFGAWSGKKEVESIAVDDGLGFVYYSDETVGVRKYRADPEAENAADELALFATEGFKGDHEGISIYETGAETGYILVSDQQADEFHVYRREGEPGNPHSHVLVKTVRVSTHESDGSEATSSGLGGVFPDGLFVAMSDDRTFHFYGWEDIAQLGLPRLESKRADKK